MLRRLPVSARLPRPAAAGPFHRPLLALTLMATVGGCATGPGTQTRAEPDFSAASWQALVQPRPVAVAGAPRVSVAEALLTADPWGLPQSGSALALTELVSVDMLERRDVSFVERRRFTPAAERQRLGLPAPAGQPPVGTSAGAEWMLHITVVTNPAVPGALDLRLVHVESGANRAGWRVAVPVEADLVGLARLVVGSVMLQLNELALGVARDASAPVVSDTYADSAVPGGATTAFLNGVRWEDLYRWELARASYESALARANGNFREAETALRRTARLRSGGSLGGS